MKPAEKQSFKNQPVASARGRSFLEDWINQFFNKDWDSFGWPLPHAFFTFGNTDVYEENGKLVYETELPGINRDDIKVRLEGDHLVISGEIKRNEKVKENQYLTMGRRSGQFQRTFHVPETYVDTDSKKVEAKLENGVLKVSLPLKESIKPQPVDIQVK